MPTHHTAPSLHLLSSSAPAHPVSSSPSPFHRPSQSPFRYIRVTQPSDHLDEKDTPLNDLVPSPRAQPSAGTPSSAYPTSRCHGPSSSRTPYAPLSARSQHDPQLLPQPPRSPLLQSRSFAFTPSQSQDGPRAASIADRIRNWLPIILYMLTSLILVVGIAFYKTQLFALLDEFAHWMQIDEQFGHAVLFGLIFLTTFPPVPLYSTLIILSGYTFGLWTGAIISYFAALSGALTVFILSRTFLRDTIARWLNSTPTIKRVVCAIEKRPKLLFLIRLAPYPYNVMNCLLAASPSLTLRTYTICTALSLFKVVIHTGLGASIHSFKDYHIKPKPDHSGEENKADTVARMWAYAGIGLCIAILVYLTVVARRAVNDELDDVEPITSRDSEETLAFLHVEREDSDLESGSMRETPFRSHQLPSRPTTPIFTRDGRF
ncbi:hypothetical protein BDN72DRAFT_831520 [Pluteus cervinus]|uniref:Uncharacterized protein n=1 Tax=Pluteus cervinus TaxID=181527 RepID=A0ACD3BDQ9_9AGAR|nr:hypothetical protein BDN72DRAFT_831520 [Pluteus cervinus]